MVTSHDTSTITPPSATPLSHQDPDKELGEAHIHDHEQPAQSPAYADRSCRRPGTGAAQVRPGPERP
jgi:hypothetical protein